MGGERKKRSHKLKKEKTIWQSRGERTRVGENEAMLESIWFELEARDLSEIHLTVARGGFVESHGDSVRRELRVEEKKCGRQGERTSWRNEAKLIFGERPYVIRLVM